MPTPPFVTLYEAKTHLVARGEARKPANAMRIRRIAADFDAPDPAIEARFSGKQG